MVEESELSGELVTAVDVFLINSAGLMRLTPTVHIHLIMAIAMNFG